MCTYDKKGNKTQDRACRDCPINEFGTHYYNIPGRRIRVGDLIFTVQKCICGEESYP